MPAVALIMRWTKQEPQSPGWITNQQLKRIMDAGELQNEIHPLYFDRDIFMQFGILYAAHLRKVVELGGHITTKFFVEGDVTYIVSIWGSMEAFIQCKTLWFDSPESKPFQVAREEYAKKIRAMRTEHGPFVIADANNVDLAQVKFLVYAA